MPPKKPRLPKSAGALISAAKQLPNLRARPTQLERQQQGAREAGRFGYIGNAGPALGSSLPSSCQGI
jgi:hypothetical protein